MAPGAFLENIEETQTGEDVPVLWQHRTGEPIGNWDISTLKEDKHGLFGEGALWLDDAAYAKTAWRGMKPNTIAGLSIGYYVRESNYDEKNPDPHINEARHGLKSPSLPYQLTTMPASTSLIEIVTR